MLHVHDLAVNNPVHIAGNIPEDIRSVHGIPVHFHDVSVDAHILVHENVDVHIPDHCFESGEERGEEKFWGHLNI